MNNLQFIATYILNNPGKTRYNDIVRNLMLWKGFNATEIVNIGGQYSRYFSRGNYLPYYHGDLWVKIDPNNRQSGFKLTEKGMTYVVKGE